VQKEEKINFLCRVENSNRMANYYGVPGYETLTKQLALQKPVAGTKELVCFSKAGENCMCISYEKESSRREGEMHKETLTLPLFECKDRKYDTYIFYCHTPGASATGDENNAYFQSHAMNDVDANSTFVCLLYNQRDNQNLGYEWLKPNVILIRRPNFGWDFGAYSDALHFTQLHQSMDKFHVFFINDTVFGPCFPSWMKKPSWIKVFREMITEEVKLAGTTINANPSPGYPNVPHVQSMFLVTDHIGLKAAVAAKVFCRYTDKEDVVRKCEIAFSKAILDAGYNLDCAATLLHGYDYRIPSQIPKNIGDVSWEGQYMGHSMHPYEVVFVKTNRMSKQLTHLLMKHNEK